MEVLSNITSQKTQPDVAVEALNFIFDVYSDCAFDYDYPVFVQGGFLNILKQIVPAVRSMVKKRHTHTHTQLSYLSKKNR